MAPRSFSPFRATRYVASVDLIDVGALAAVGVRLVLLDRDNTCVPRDTRVAPPAVREWLGRLRAAGIATCMLSNNFHSGEVAASACELGCPVVDHAMKPAPFSVWVAMARMGVGPEQTVIVGDQVFTDVLGANLTGLDSILVAFIRKPGETKIGKRRTVEQFILRCYARSARHQHRLGDIRSEAAV